MPRESSMEWEAKKGRDTEAQRSQREYMGHTSWEQRTGAVLWSVGLSCPGSHVLKQRREEASSAVLGQ